ncbi:hypothetical protein [Dokdonella soli]|uniref:hypothetical protein n=1 Tax=Dokdonella soli TaxID=529810 RepID=UPI0031DE9137
MAVAMMFVAGCASSPPAAKFSQHADASAVIRSGDTTSVNVMPASGITIADYEMTRVIDRIKTQR